MLDPVGALAAWASTTLIVPPGHPRSGAPMALPDFATDWLRASWDAHESALSTARKNAKSAIAAVLALGYLVGPLRRPGWRGAIASITKEKAGELRRQVREIAEASNLDIRIRRSPYPGVIESSTGSLDTLSADRTAGHAAGYDLVIVDETGLFPLRARDLLAGLRSSVSARAGKIRHISIRGDSELFREILENSAVVSHVYAAADDCEVGDEAAWRAANPGLGTIKALSYMREEVARVAGVASDEPSFRALDLNLEISPTREMVCTPGDLRACFVDEIECRGSRVCRDRYRRGGLGYGGGGVLAGDRGAADLAGVRRRHRRSRDRAKRDGADYVATCSGVASCGPIRAARCRLRRSSRTCAPTWPTPRSGGVCRRVPRGELRDALPWPLTVVRSGMGPDGSAAVRAFQRVVLTGCAGAAEQSEPRERYQRIDVATGRQRQPRYRQRAVAGPD